VLFSVAAANIVSKLVSFCHYDKIPEVNNLKEERFILAHCFRGVSSWSVSSIAFWPEVRQNITVGSTWWSKDVHFLREKEEEREAGRERKGPWLPSKINPSKTRSQ
jgi:hypothetical protein